MELVFELFQILNFQFVLFFSGCVIEGVQAGFSMLRLLIHHPVITLSELLDGSFAPSGDPVILDRVEDES